jgi:hypothetical protein
MTNEWTVTPAEKRELGVASARIRELEAYARKLVDEINRLTTELVKAKAANRRKDKS